MCFGVHKNHNMPKTIKALKYHEKSCRHSKINLFQRQAGKQAVRRRQVACGMWQVAGKRHIRSTAESNSQALLLLPKNVLAKCRIRIHQGRPRKKGQGVAGVAGVFVWHICPSLLQSLLSLVLFFCYFLLLLFSSFLGGLLACT